MNKIRIALAILACAAIAGRVWKQTKAPHSLVSENASTTGLSKRSQKPLFVSSPAVPAQEAVTPVEKKEAERKLEILKEVFQSKNDNDPRLDQDLSHLTDYEKAIIEQNYRNLQPEARNERGTIVFLVGRSLSSSSDFAFLREVLKEPQCLSLTNCTQPSTDLSGHESGATAVTEEYPQIVALKALETFLAANPHSPQAITLVEEAAKSKGPLLRGMAQNDLRNFTQHP